jgi:hypothetical protein
MPGDESDRRRHAPVGEGDSRVGEGAHRRSNTGDDFEADPGSLQGDPFLPPATEDEGIASLQPHDHLVSSGEADEEPVDVRLTSAAASATLADIEALRSTGHPFEEHGVRQRVVDDRARPFQELGPSERQEPGVTGTGSHQIDRTIHVRIHGTSPRHLKIADTKKPDLDDETGKDRDLMSGGV